VAAIVVPLLLGAFCMLVFDHATVPFSQPNFCASCHEMQAPHASWQQGRHFVNRTGVQVTCVECHLPHKDDRIPHLVARFWAGGKDLSVHLFGQYDAEKSRRLVLQTLPSERCVKCHANLATCPSSSSVTAVHAVALKHLSDRGHACVTCHDMLHGPPAERPTPKTYEPGDNSYCLVCHANFEKEEFAATHVKAGIVCTKCHGSSDDHAADEEHLTVPDVIFSKAQVNASCLTSKCHPHASLETEIGHRPFFAGADVEHLYCTDCHGQHRTPNRTRRWDKETRQLIEVNGRPVSPTDAASGKTGGEDSM
jgi:nitrate/TMAO reductase-like tetraheme cytochrome c subunit